jgi:hypothetical protein
MPIFPEESRSKPGRGPGLEARWQIGRHAYLQTDYGVFFAGPFLQ